VNFGEPCVFIRSLFSFFEIYALFPPTPGSRAQDVVRRLCQALHATGHRPRQSGRLDDRTGAALEATVACRVGQEEVEERVQRRRRSRISRDHGHEPPVPHRNTQDFGQQVSRGRVGRPAVRNGPGSERGAAAVRHRLRCLRSASVHVQTDAAIRIASSNNYTRVESSINCFAVMISRDR